MDNRLKVLASNLVNHSTQIKNGEKVLIHYTGEDARPLVRQIIKEVYKVGGLPFVQINTQQVSRELLLCGDLELLEQQLKLQAEFDVQRMKSMDAYIGIGAVENSSELADVDIAAIEMNQKYYFKPVHTDGRLSKKWVVLRYPTNSMAQLSNTSLEAFEDFYFNVCCLDYKKMADAMEPLKQLMEKTDKVHIKGIGTDLTFSIKGLPAIKCAGNRNIPDGEIYTAPVKNSVNGYITYNTPSEYNSFTYENVKLTFADGKIVEATSNDNERINKVFDTDEGARYVGEFAIGVNPYILKPMKNTLFDEKICGSFHFTPGNAYAVANNGNSSAIHWDLVCIQRSEYGGGEIYFDDVLIRKDGIFVLDELKVLNPENLV